VPDETNILEVWTENGKYICFIMTNIFVLKWQIYLFDFWQILFVEAWRRGAASSEYHTGRKLLFLLLLLMMYIKDFF